MKKILLVISFVLTTIACEKKNNSHEYSQEEYNTIEAFMQNQIKDFDRELLNIEVLQVNKITVSNIDSIQTNIPKLSFLVGNLTLVKGEPTDSILKMYNELLNISLINKDKSIGKLLFVKVTVLAPSKIEESAYFPIPLNKRNNIPMDINDLLND